MKEERLLKYDLTSKVGGRGSDGNMISHFITPVSWGKTKINRKIMCFSHLKGDKPYNITHFKDTH